MTYICSYLITCTDIQFVEHWHVYVGRGRHDKGVAQGQEAILGAISVNLSRCSQQSNGRHETAGPKNHLYQLIESSRSPTRRNIYMAVGYTFRVGVPISRGGGAVGAGGGALP
jgi:hypothetical protein